MSQRQTRVGAVSYVNTKPLVYRLTEFAPRIQLLFDVPSRLANRLSSGDLDIALIPSIEYLLNPAYKIVSDACIACRGPVLSVKLLSRTPMHTIRTLALDEGSRTSGVLARILLFERFGLTPRLLTHPMEANVEQCPADAVVLIGDRAVHMPPTGFREVWDLGEQWYAWAGIPFVFAMWVARGSVQTEELASALTSARDAGVANLDEIADQHATGIGLSREGALTYLRDNLHFFLGPRETEGLNLYHHHAAEMQAISGTELPVG
jgi:chorismate dehydratase